MNNGGDAAEQIVRLSLESFEVAARLTGSAAKNIAVMLAAALRQEGKSKGKARLSNMIKSGKELKVFSLQNKDLKKFTEQAKHYGVLYCVLKSKNNKDKNAAVDIIARAEDAAKIQRIVERFDLCKVDKAEVVNEAGNELTSKTGSELIIEEAVGGERNKEINPIKAKTDKSPPSRQNSEPSDLQSDKGAGFSERKPSVREKLKRYAAERSEPIEQPKQQIAQTIHTQPKSNRKKSKKER